MTLVIHRPRAQQPQAVTSRAPEWAFVWNGAYPNGDGWARGSGLVATSGLGGQGVTFTGNVGNSFSKTGGIATAQDRVTFVTVQRWVSGVGTTNGIVAMNSDNTGHIFYSASGTPRYTKGGVEDLNAAWTFTSGHTYVCVVSHDRITGKYHLLGRNLNTGVISETSGTSTSTPTAGNGTYKVGGFRDTDGSRAFNGDIFFAAGGFFYTPLPQAYAYLHAPYSVFAPRRIWVPVSVAGGGGTGALTATLGALTASATGTLALNGALSKTLGALTSSATGAVALTGTLSKTLGTLTLTAEGAGATVNTGSLSKTLGTLTSSATGTLAITGTLSKTLGAATLSAAGYSGGAISGTLTATLGALTLNAQGGLPRAQGGGIPRRLRRKQKLVVEIDGEQFLVDSPEQALEILDKAKQEAKELAEKAVQRAAKATKRPARKVIADARRALEVPDIKAPPEVMDAAAAVMDSIRATYKEAMQSVEIAAWMAKREADIERDDEDILLLL